MKVNIPYQTHANKQVFDYALLLCNQLNNVNCAENVESIENTEDNHIFLFMIDSKLYLYASLARKNESNESYTSILDTWIELKDVEFLSSNDIFIKSDESKLYSFDLKKFFSTLSFSSDYKKRNVIQLDIENNEIFYSMSDTLNVSLAIVVTNENIENKIYDSYLQYKKQSQNYLEDNSILSITNVDKNSFLLPYSNYKEYLNFTIASNQNKSFLYKKDNKSYFLNLLQNKNKDILFLNNTLLREDKFKLKENKLEVSTGLWQLLIILQSSKFWQEMSTDSNIAKLTFRQGAIIYHIFDVDNINDSDFVNENIQQDNMFLVGKLYADELFLLNKLFTDSKKSYFDFSKQKFIGNNYVFSDNKENNITEVEFRYKIENNILPLKLSFTEIKHYIGSDLSQKNFVLYFYTDGINVMIDLMNSDETIIENRILFNHSMSKTYLSI